jgi:hypothetical protein
VCEDKKQEKCHFFLSRSRASRFKGNDEKLSVVDKSVQLLGHGLYERRPDRMWGHASSCPKGDGFPSSGSKRPGRGANH